MDTAIAHMIDAHAEHTRYDSVCKQLLSEKKHPRLDHEILCERIQDNFM